MEKCTYYMVLLMVLYITIRTSQQNASGSYSDCASSATFRSEAKHGEQGSRCALVQGADFCDTGFECCIEDRPGRTGLCADIDECSTEEDNCHWAADCTNTVGAYECTCRAGFSGDGTSCEDIDECFAGEDDCCSGANCINTVGSYTCEDINECELGTFCTKPTAVCFNILCGARCRIRIPG